jgi:RNA polymerase-binding transcription factor DksA
MPRTRTQQKLESTDTSECLREAEQELGAQREKLLWELSTDCESPDELADGWQDRDSASESEIRDVEFSHREALHRRVLEIDRAIERIKLHTYGRCVYCGRAINPKRLAEQPEVSSCLACRCKFEDEAERINLRAG